MKLALSATVAANGIATVNIRPDRLQTWRVDQVSVQLASAPLGSTCTLTVNGSFVTLLVPNGDAAAGDPSITLQTGDVMTVQWTGCSPGTVGKVFILYALVES